METVKEKQKLFRNWLSRALEERQARNPQYSLRSFARDLELDASQLSAILKGKKGISLQRAQKMVRVLDLSKAEADSFLLMAKLEHSRRFSDRAIARQEFESLPAEQKENFQSLTLDTYRMISDLSTTDVLEYLRRPRCNQKPEVIAGALQISIHQLNEALERLVRLEFLVKKGERYQVKTGPTMSPSGIPSEAIRNHHQQVLKKAETALHFQSIDQREFSSTEMLIRQDQIPEMKKYLKEMWSEFCNRFVDNQTGDAVYELSYQLFEIGKIEIQNKKNKEKVL